MGIPDPEPPLDAPLVISLTQALEFNMFDSHGFTVFKYKKRKMQFNIFDSWLKDHERLHSVMYS